MSPIHGTVSRLAITVSTVAFFPLAITARFDLSRLFFPRVKSVSRCMTWVFIPIRSKTVKSCEQIGLPSFITRSHLLTLYRRFLPVVGSLKPIGLAVLEDILGVRRHRGERPPIDIQNVSLLKLSPQCYHTRSTGNFLCSLAKGQYAKKRRQVLMSRREIDVHPPHRQKED